MKRILILLLAVWAGTVAAEESVTVYQLTGAIRCLDGTGIPPERAADLLRGQGVTVMSAERRKLPQDSADSCGAPAGEANLMKVSPADWSAFLAKNPDAGGYGIWVFDESPVQVYKYDGKLQCGMGQELPLDEMEKELRAAGIEVVTSRKGTDGLVHINVCGASTGSINVYVIDRTSLPAAERLGYQLLVTRETIRLIKPGGTQSRPRAPGNDAPPLTPGDTQEQGPVPLLW